MKRLQKLIGQERPLQVLIVIISLWWLVFGFLVLRQHQGLRTQLDDLGNMAQPLWNSLQGRFMEYSNTAEYQGIYSSRLAGHANYIFILLIPLYGLWPDPQVLLITQVFVVGLGAIPLYLLGRRLFKASGWLALVAPVLYLINPGLHDAVFYDMHAIVIAAPLLLAAVYFLVTERLEWFGVFALLFALCKEDTALVLVMLGVWFYWYRRNWKVSGAIVISALSFFMINLFILMPSFQDQRGHVLISDRYGHLGGSVGGIVTTLLTQPHLIVADLMAKDLPGYTWQLLVGFGLLPLLSPASIMALPHIAINLLSNNPITSQVYGYYYTAPILAVFSLSSLLSLKAWKKSWLGLTTKQLALIILLVAMINSWWYSPLPFSRTGLWREYQLTLAASQLESVQSLIPEDASLTVQNNLGPHFVNRRDLVRFPYRIDSSEYILIFLEEPYGVVRDRPRQRNFVHLSQLFPQQYYDYGASLFASDQLGLIYAQDGYYLFERGTSTDMNQEGFFDFYVRAQELFAPYQSAYPVEYTVPDFP